ncbi:c-type cytochrome [Pseudomonas cichorii]|uniref:c-type cytochrome n=1 Tax=Pseudomonas cichorii TaxID=36746 RepID=UPI001C887EC0|nr:c-type cytochrome [Pseudomonas cichorii]MBX8486852.1 c-type cytochrome [Pseudomonas cichorii]MBX8490882.1 c-type cytochrome [Pseudomonas cichorii]MBX8509024.1 c-type cytochrome [Pseudomonas cichorii]MBX8515620.1 c-type cytochrome [Pseudomonas cichorii]MBX8518330.1 c-type cytochrome [Pseudomonas cichorii]
MKYLTLLAIFLLPLGAQAAQDPETVFNRSCGICHNGQLKTAPQKGDTAAWAPRLDQGMDLLVERVISGYSVMPPRGLCSECTPEDYKTVIEWMAQ